MSEIIHTNTKIQFANTLRGYAALFVVISHYLSTFWYKRDSVSHLINAPLLSAEVHATPVYVVWFNLFPLFDWGAYGVALFFIISGFVIPFSIQGTNGLGFCMSRLFRILPTYVIGFSITLLALYVCGKYFSASWPYTFQEVFIHYIPGIRDILESRNIDVIIWTLEVEIKFYLLVALSIVWFRNYSLKVFLIPAVFFLLTCYCAHMIPEWAIKNLAAFIRAEMYMMVIPYIIFMFIGVGFHYLYCHKIALDQGYLLIGILFALFCIAWWIGPYSENLILAWSYGFALLTFMFAFIFPHFFKANPISNFLADISYPLYIIHSIAGYVALRVLIDKNFKVWTALTLVSIVSLLLSWFLHVLIEQPTQKIGRVYATRLNPNYIMRPAWIKTIINAFKFKNFRELN